MSEGKYGKILTIILGIVVIAVLILLGFLGYDVYRKRQQIEIPQKHLMILIQT